MIDKRDVFGYYVLVLRQTHDRYFPADVLDAVTWEVFQIYDFYRDSFPFVFSSNTG